MSGIFGILNRNGKPVEENTVSIMLDAMSYWEPDDSSTWIDGPVALGHTMLWNTPESKYEHFPLEKDAYVLTMDARIDNRNELLKELELSDRPLEEIGDSEFILAAYRKWGEDCPKHLLGDFAFAIWDDKKQQLFCARDHVGVKQFYYHLTDALFIFGNDLKGLLKHPDISKKINDDAVANYIVNSKLLSSTLTFFENIEKLPPATSLIVTSEDISKTSYWKLKDAPKVKLKNVEEYAKKLRELLEEAVYARMCSDYPISSHLSGGLDSSSIAVIAARKLKEKDEKLLAFNWLHQPTEEDNPTDYEWSISNTIAKTEGIDHHYVSLTAENIYLYIKKRDIAYGETTTFWYEYPVREAVESRGSRTILTGWGGDELSTYHGQSFYSDLFLQGKWNRLFHELQVKVDKKNRSLKSILSIIYHHIFISFIPKKLYCKMPKIKCLIQSFPFLKQSFLPIIKKEMKNSLDLLTQPKKTIRKHMLAYWYHGHLQNRIESWSTAAISNRLEYSYPLLDRRILEFTFGMPAEVFINNGKGRHVFRLAVSEFLSKEILSEQKIYEPKRVHRLVQLTQRYFTWIVEKEMTIDKQAYYIDNNKIYDQLSKMELTTELNKNTLELFEHLETMLAVYFSDYLQKKI